MTLPTLTPAEAEKLMRQGARLIDVRSPDAYARVHIPGAENRPLDTLISDSLHDETGRPIIFHCQSGLRTRSASLRLRNSTQAPAHVMEGGLDQWRTQGLPLHRDRTQPLELSRQVHLVVGLMIVLSTALGVLVSPHFHLVAGLMGAGLLFAGATGFCGMARLLQNMPWNRA